MTIAQNLADILARIEAARKTAIAPAPATHLVAVSKTVPQEGIREAIGCGQRLFGENRVQEALAKYPALKSEHPGLQLHLIGPLQTNKVKDAVALFDVIQTVDREKLARALAAEVARQDRRPRLHVQINIGEEPQKAGVPPREADAFIALCRDELHLDLDGLMCIPPAGVAPAPYFALLREIATRNGLAGLSMGMSDDFEMAVRLGATLVRVGSAIFGARQPPAVKPA
jgi:pyridoxal phosphate enzyme (YggS family)